MSQTQKNFIPKIDKDEAEKIFLDFKKNNDLIKNENFEIVADFLFWKNKNQVFYVFKGFLLYVGVNANSGEIETLDPDDLDGQLKDN